MEWFWEIVDANGLTGLPSDERAALAQLVRDRADAARYRDALQKIESMSRGRINYSHASYVDVQRLAQAALADI